MNLLKDQPFNFRYYFLTTKSDNPEIVICFYSSTSDIADNDEETRLETTELKNLNKTWDTSKTVKCTCYDDEVQINEFNEKLVNYFKARVADQVSKISIYNYTRTYNKIIFEPRVFEEMLKCCTNIYLDLYDCAFRTTNTQYPTITKLEINSGNLLLDNTTVLRIDEANIINLTIDIYNKEDSNVYMNFMMNKKLTANKLNIYSTIKTVFTCTTTDNEVFTSSATLSLCCIHLFGMECIQKDSAEPRILVQGFKKAMINVINIDDDVRYGAIFKFDHMDSISINEVNRNIKDMFTGTFITIGQLATLNLHYFNINITKESSINEDYSFITFLKDTADLTRSINIFDTAMTNEAGTKVNLCHLSGVTIHSIYMSQCIINENIIPFKKDDDATLEKLYYNKSTIYSKTNDYEISGVIALSMNDCTFYCNDHSLTVKAEKLSMSGGLYYFSDMKISCTKMISKISTEKLELHGDKLEIDNTASEMSTSFFDNNSKFDIGEFKINKFKTTFNSSMLKIKKFTVDTETSITLTQTVIDPNDKTIEINFNCSATANMFFDCTNERTVNINITDNDQYYPRNKLFITKLSSTGENTYHFNINVPTTIEFTNSNPKYIYNKMADGYDSDQSITYKIDQLLDLSDIVTTVINNSEKKCTISDSYEDKGRVCYDVNMISS